jgi:hypothetical protein
MIFVIFLRQCLKRSNLILYFKMRIKICKFNDFQNFKINHPPAIRIFDLSFSLRNLSNEFEVSEFLLIKGVFIEISSE